MCCVAIVAKFTSRIFAGVLKQIIHGTNWYHTKLHHSVVQKLGKRPFLVRNFAYAPIPIGENQSKHQLLWRYIPWVEWVPF